MTDMDEVTTPSWGSIFHKNVHLDDFWYKFCIYDAKSTGIVYIVQPYTGRSRRAVYDEHGRGHDPCLGKPGFEKMSISAITVVDECPFKLFLGQILIFLAQKVAKWSI